MASAICGLIDKLNLDCVLGAVSGDDTVMVILPDVRSAENATDTLLKLSI